MLSTIFNRRSLSRIGHLLLSVLFVSSVLISNFAPVAKALSNYTISGTLSYGTTPYVNTRVTFIGVNTASEGSSLTDSSGHFSVANLPDDNYMVRLFGGAPVGQFGPSFTNDTSLSASVTVAGADVTRDISFSTATVQVQVQDSTGQPKSGVPLAAMPTGGQITTATGNLQFNALGTNSGITDASGTGNLPVIPGQTYKFCANINDTEICQSNVSVTGDTEVTIRQQVTHSVSGVLSYGPTPYVNTRVTLLGSKGSEGSSLTDANGHFTVPNLPDDSYRVRLSGGAPTGQFGPSFTNDTSLSASVVVSGSDIVRNISFNTATIRVIFDDGTGQPKSGVPLAAQPTAGQITTATGNLQFNALGTNSGTTDANGAANIPVIPGQTYKFCATVEGTEVCENGISVIGDGEVTIHHQTSYSVSGTLSYGTVPYVNTRVTLIGSNSASEGSGMTDANGHFTVPSLPNDSYKVRLSGGAPAGQFGPTFTNDTSLSANVTVAGANVTRDVSFDTATVQVIFKDGAGQPKAGVPLAAKPTSGQVTTATGNLQFNALGTNSGITDANGVGNLPVIPGQTYTFCANVDGTEVCKGDVAVAGDMSVVIQDSPNAPAGLAVDNPTRSPHLSWGAVASATEYKVYRDDQQVAIVTTATYNDSEAVDGLHSYYVKASNEAGDSEASNTVSTFVDTIQPQIYVTTTPTPNAQGWNNGDVTVHFMCSDPLLTEDPASHSGIEYCEPDVVVSTEGASIIEGFVTDKAGNTNETVIIVSVDRTAPTVTPQATPGPNSYGWNNSDVTVAFNCDDSMSGILTCFSSHPGAFTSEGVYDVVGTATDNAGNTSTQIQTVRIDKTAPVIGTQTWSLNPLQPGQSTTLTIPASDSLSGIASVEYSLDGAAPQQMIYNSSIGAWQATFGANLVANTYLVRITASDKAGNAAAVTDVLTVTPSGSDVNGHAKILPSGGDLLPIALDTSANPAKLTVGFTHVATPASGSFDLSYKVKNNQNEFSLSSTSVSWVVVQDGSHASILGTADMVIHNGGSASTLSGVTVRFDIFSGSATESGHILVRIYSPGADPYIASPTYVIDDNVESNGTNLIIQ